MATDLYVYAGQLQNLERGKNDVTGIPPAASLIVAEQWAIMCKEAGGEDKLIASLKIKDVREVNHA